MLCCITLPGDVGAFCTFSTFPHLILTAPLWRSASVRVHLGPNDLKILQMAWPIKEIYRLIHVTDVLRSSLYSGEAWSRAQKVSLGPGTPLVLALPSWHRLHFKFMLKAPGHSGNPAVSKQLLEFYFLQPHIVTSSGREKVSSRRLTEQGYTVTFPQAPGMSLPLFGSDQFGVHP